MAFTRPWDVTTPKTSDQFSDVCTVIKNIKIDFRERINAFSPLGQPIEWYGESEPFCYKVCNGQAISRASYPALFAIYGTRYGAGNGSTTFNIPDLRGLFLRGYNPDYFGNINVTILNVWSNSDQLQISGYNDKISIGDGISCPGVIPDNSVITDILSSNKLYHMMIKINGNGLITGSAGYSAVIDNTFLGGMVMPRFKDHSHSGTNRAATSSHGGVDGSVGIRRTWDGTLPCVNDIINFTHGREPRPINIACRYIIRVSSVEEL